MLECFRRFKKFHFTQMLFELSIVGEKKLQKLKKKLSHLTSKSKRRDWEEMRSLCRFPEYASSSSKFRT